MANRSVDIQTAANLLPTGNLSRKPVANRLKSHPGTDTSLTSRVKRLNWLELTIPTTIADLISDCSIWALSHKSFCQLPESSLRSKLDLWLLPLTWSKCITFYYALLEQQWLTMHHFIHLSAIIYIYICICNLEKICLFGLSITRLLYKKASILNSNCVSHYQPSRLKRQT